MQRLSLTLSATLFSGLIVGLLAGDASADALADARTLCRKGAYEESLRAVEQLVASEPDNVAAWRLGQFVAHRLGTEPAKRPFEGSEQTAEPIRRGLRARRLPPKEAISAFTKLLEEGKASTLFRLDLANALIEAGRNTQAESELALYLDEHPGDAEALALKGKSLASRGKFTGARSAYEQAVASAPGLPDATVALARLYADAKKDDDARELLTAALKRYPRNPRLLLALGADLMRTGEAEDAEKTLRQVLALPATPPKGAAHEQLAEVYRALRKYKEAEASARKAIEANPACVSAIRTLGFVKQKRKDYEGAIEEYAKVLRLRPDWVQAHVDLGFVKTLKGDRIGARKAFEKALKLDRKHVDANVKAGVYYYLGKNYKQAGKLLETALRRDRDHLHGNRYMGYVLLAEGKPKKALKHFEAVAKLAPRDAAAKRMAGRALIEMGKLEKAEEAMREAVGRNNKDAFSFFDLGKVLEKREEFEDAESAYRKAIELDPTLTHPFLYLAELIDDVHGEPEKALPFYRQYLAAGGDDKGDTVQKRIEQIEKSLEKKEKK